MLFFQLHINSEVIIFMKIDYIPKGYVSINYDEDHDIMTVRFGNKKNTYVGEIDEYVDIEGLYCMDDDELQGLQCYYYRKNSFEKELAELIKEYTGINIKLLPLQRLQDFE